jgi:subtilisin-like proprotein convertase family protein
MFMSFTRASQRLTSAGLRGSLILAAAFAVALGLTSSSSRVAARGAQQPTNLNGIAPEGLAQIESLLREKETRTPAERKIDSQLLYAWRMQQGLPVAPGVQTLEVDIPYADDGHAIVEVGAKALTPNLLSQLNGLSLEVKETGPANLELHVALSQVPQIAAEDDVLFVQPKQLAFTNRIDPPAPVGSRLPPGVRRRAAAASAIRQALDDEHTTNAVGTGQGIVTSQADITHRAAVFRGLTGFNGTGVKIGVLSDGVAHLAAAQASGDLGAVTVLPGQTGSGDEGTAMLELIHDIAPGAQLYFATGFTSITSFAQNIRDLRTAGCDIIVDDVGYYVETPFQDGQGPGVSSPTNGGIVTQAVNDVTTAGALYFSAAGNSGNINDGTSGVWEGNFADGGATAAPLGAGNAHNFAAGQPFDTLTLAGSGPINLYWSDPLGGSGNDYDIFRLNTAGTAVAASSTNLQTGLQDPFEQMTASTSSPRIVIVKKTGAAARFLHLNTNRGRLSTATAGQIHGHAAASASGSFGVAAVNAGVSYPNPFSTSNVVETFSSDGPRRVFYLGDGTVLTPGNVSSTGGVLLLKPDIAAADGAAVTGAGGFSTPFFGTSAAAPNAAAIMALLKSQNPGFTQLQLKSLLLSTALDIEAAGVDRDSGAGIVMAAAPQAGCTFTMSPPGASAPIAGGALSATVNASSGTCNWVAWSTVPWITMATSGGAGVGSGPLNLALANNPGPARSASIMIQGGQVTTVSQLGNPPLTYGFTGSVPIPDNNTVESALIVSGLTGLIGNVTATVHITHTFDSDLTISLVGPDGTTVPLAAHRGSSGDNYGSACTPTTSRTTFDDSVANPISVGTAPFVGSFRPEQPLASFNGKSGSGANGTWKLRVSDDANLDTGTLLCWSISINQQVLPQPPGVGVYRPTTGRWYINGIPPIDWGLTGDMPVPGDYNGDGIRDVAVFRPSNGTWYVNGGITAQWGLPGDIPVPADYNGDHITDMAVFRPSAGVFFVRNIGTFSWGLPGDLPVVGDYNGDGLADLAVYRPSNGTWYIRNIGTFPYGLTGDIPVPADYDGNGVTDIAVFRPATGVWFVKDQFTQSWGLSGDIPVPMDRNGDGRAELGVFRRSTGYWFFFNVVSSTSEIGPWGAPGDIPLGRAMPPIKTMWGDYDGDRKADLTVYRPSTGDWVSLRSLSGMTDYTVRTWGLSTDVPVGRDYDGDGKIDPAVFRPSIGRWLVLLSSNLYSTMSYLSQDWGISTDTPVPADYDGDGKTDFALYRPSAGKWLILLSTYSNTAYGEYNWGLSTDIPVPADFDGDGVTDLGLFRPSLGRFLVYNRMTGLTSTQDWGLSGDVPAVADYDGDGKADLAVYRPSLGRWFIKSSIDGSYTIADWGLSGDYVVPADYDGDGKADIAVYRPSNGTWYVRGLFNRSWGLSTDIPVLKNP